MLSKAIGTGAGALGAVLVAIPGMTVPGLATWTIGNSAWMYAGWKTNDRYILSLFTFYLLTTIGGLALHLEVL
jgi:hypothetical protein